VPYFSPLFLTRFDRCRIDIVDVLVVLPHRIHNYGSVLYPVLMNVGAAGKAFLNQKGNWTPEGKTSFRELFWRPPPLSHDESYSRLLLDAGCDVLETAPKPSVWLNLQNVSLCVADDPMEAWLGCIIPHKDAAAESNEFLDLETKSKCWSTNCGGV
jgi:hypothetical protein